MSRCVAELVFIDAVLAIRTLIFLHAALQDFRHHAIHSMIGNYLKINSLQETPF